MGAFSKKSKLIYNDVINTGTTWHIFIYKIDLIQVNIKKLKNIIRILFYLLVKLRNF